MPEHDSNGKGEVTAGDLAKRFIMLAQEQGVELRKGEAHTAHLAPIERSDGSMTPGLLQPGETLPSVRRGHCVECADLAAEQEVKPCDYCKVPLCSEHWRSHECEGKKAADFIMLKEREAAEHFITEAQHKYRPFRAEMERFRPKDELQAAEWDSAWEAHWRGWKAWLETEWAGVRLGHWGDKWLDELRHTEE